MKKLICALAVLAAIALPAAAEQAPVKQLPVEAGENGMSINDCLGILAGLNAIDAGARVIIAQGKPTESVETIRFKFPTKVRDAISHNLFVLGQVQQEAQAANRRAQLEVGKGETIKPGSREALEFDQRMADYTARPCKVELDHVRDADLDLEHNDVPSSIMALLTKIRDK